MLMTATFMSQLQSLMNRQLLTDSPGAFMTYMPARQQLNKVLIKDIPVLAFTVDLAHVVHDLEAVFDSELTLAAYIDTIAMPDIIYYDSSLCVQRGGR
jgi:adenine-specific DNA methylase